MNDIIASPPSAPYHVRVLFLIDSSASMAEGNRLEGISWFLDDMRKDLASIHHADLSGSIEVQAIRFADTAEWHVRQPTQLTALDWPPLPLGDGSSTGAALALAASALFDPSARDAAIVVVLIANATPTDDFAKGLARFTFAATDRQVLRIAIAPDRTHCSVLSPFASDQSEVYQAGATAADLDAALRRALRERLLYASGAPLPVYDGDLNEDCPFVLGAASPDFARDTAPAVYSRLDDAQFTVYRPKTVRPREWKPMLAFVHLAERRPDAPDTEPDPTEQVRQQAHALLGANAAGYRNFSADTRQGIPKESEITLVPDVPGVSFNPRSRTFRWVKDVHREEFDLRADASLDGKVARGSISAYLGVILIARIDLAISVDSSYRTADDAEIGAAVHATPYRKIFASYSRKDTEIVRQFEQFIETTGDRFLQDVSHLRAGEEWDDGLLRLIDQADVFQLFWSSNSMGSPHVRREWEYALGLGRPAFIRPTFWEDPFPESPADSLPPESLSRLHFHRLASVPAQPSASERPVNADVQASVNPSRASPSSRPQTKIERSPPLPSASRAPSDSHCYYKLAKPNQKKLRRFSIFALLTLVAAGAVLATILLWMLR
jgi:uncharacterized protein YegL